MDTRPASAIERATQAASRYINKQVSLLSTSDVRYNGELYTVDPAETSIALKHVDCLGTENRRSGSEAISASDCTYEFIIFRAVNIKSLRLEEGDRRDLTREILEPLRQAGQETNSKRQSRSAEDTKRRVGYDPSRQDYQYDQRYVQQQAAPQQAPAQSSYYYGSSSRGSQYPVQGSSSRQYSQGQYYDSRGASNQYGSGYGGGQSGGSQHYYGSSSRGQAPPPQYSSRGYGHQAPPPQYSSSRGYAPPPQYGSPSGYPPQGGSRQSSRGYYDQRVTYPPQQSRDYYNRPRDSYNMYGRQQDRSRGYYPPRDSRGYQVSPSYVNDRRGYYPRQYDQGRNYQSSYQRQGDRRQFNSNMGRNRDNRGRGGMRGPSGNTRGGMRGPQEAPGTGAFLQSKNQQEDPTDMNKLKDDFDFGTSLAKFQKERADNGKGDDEKNELVGNSDGVKADGGNDDVNDTEVTTGDTEEKSDKNRVNTAASANDDGLKEDKKDIDAATDQFASMSLDIEPKYDKSKSFFDNLPQETRKDKRNEQRRNESMQERNIDAETFGNIAISYRSKHRYNNRNQRGGNQVRRQRGIDVPRGYDIRGFATRRGQRRPGGPQMGPPNLNQQYQRKSRGYDDVSQQRWRVK